jgi:hypothetical protein
MAALSNVLQQLTNQLSNQIDSYKTSMRGGTRGGQNQNQLQQFQQLAGNVKVYTGPKQGKFIINKHGKKVYIDRKGLKTDIPYKKKEVKRNAKK